MTHTILSTYEQSKRLKSLGFDWECYKFYYDNCIADKVQVRNCQYPGNHNAGIYTSAPELHQVQDWLRTTHNLVIVIEPKPDNGKIVYSYYIFSTVICGIVGWSDSSYDYPKALEKSTCDAIELIEISNQHNERKRESIWEI